MDTSQVHFLFDANNIQTAGGHPKYPLLAQALQTLVGMMSQALQERSAAAVAQDPLPNQQSEVCRAFRANTQLFLGVCGGSIWDLSIATEMRILFDLWRSAYITVQTRDFKVDMEGEEGDVARAEEQGAADHVQAVWVHILVNTRRIDTFLALALADHQHMAKLRAEFQAQEKGKGEAPTNEQEPVPEDAEQRVVDPCEADYPLP